MFAMPKRFKFDADKAVASIQYIVSNISKPDFYKIFKILYFADQKHLVKFGRPISGDFYIAMDNGPVPSKIYDILKALRGDLFFEVKVAKFNKLIQVYDNHMIKSLTKPDLNVLSESELECIDESINENKGLSFESLKRKSHGPAYKKAIKNIDIPVLEMAREGGATKEMLNYIELNLENNQI